MNMRKQATDVSKPFHIVTLEDNSLTHEPIK